MLAHEPDRNQTRRHLTSDYSDRLLAVRFRHSHSVSAGHLANVRIKGPLAATTVLVELVSECQTTPLERDRKRPAPDLSGQKAASKKIMLNEKLEPDDDSKKSHPL